MVLYCHRYGAMRLVATYAGILENLGESGVDVDGRGDVVDGGIELHVGGDLLDDVGRMGTIGGTAENLARGIGYKLYHALRRVDGKGFAVGTIVALEGVAVDGLLLGLIFGDAYAGSFGIGEDGRRHDVEANFVGLANDGVDGTEAHEGGCMCQHLTTWDVAYGIDMRHGGEHLVVDGDAFWGVGNACGCVV